MSNSVDNRVVQMEFDNKQFEKGVKTTLGSLDKLSKSLKLEDSSKGLKDLQKTADKFNLESVGKAADEVGKHFTAMQVVAFTVLQRITNAAITAGKKIASALTIQMPKDGFGKYEQKTEAVQTIMYSTGKSIEDVNDVLNKLMKYTDETSYSFTDMTTSISKFTSAGIDLNTAERAMEGIANWAATAGVGPQKAASAFYNLTQAMSAGSMKSIDWKSISLLNMNTKQFKETVLETTKEMIEANEVTKEQADLFKKANVNVQNFDTSLSNGWFSKDIMLKVFEKYADQTTDFGLAAFHAAQEAKTFNDAIGAIKDALGSGWLQTWEYIFGNYEEAKEFWTNMTNTILEFTDRFTSARNAALEFWHDFSGRKNLIAGLKAAWEAFLAVIEPVISAFKTIFSPNNGLLSKKYSKGILRHIRHTNNLSKATFKLGDYLLLLTKKFKDFAEKLKPSEKRLEQIESIFTGLFAAIKLVYLIIQSFVRAFRDDFGDATKEAGESIWTMAANLGDFVYELEQSAEKGDVFYKAFKTIFDGIKTVVDAAKEAIHFFIEKIGELQGTDASLPNFTSFKDVLLFIATTLKNLIVKLYSGAKAVWAFVSPFLSKAWSALLPILKTIFGIIMSLPGAIRTAFINVSEFITKLRDGTVTIKDLKNVVKDWVKGLWESVQDKFDGTKFGEFLKRIPELVDKAKLAVSDFVDKIKEQINKMDFIDWSKLGAFAILLTTLLIIGRAFRIISRLADTFDSLGKNISRFFKTITRSARYRAFASIILSIGLLAGAIYLLTTVADPEKLKLATISILSLIAAVIVLSLALSLLAVAAGDAKTIGSMAVMIASLSSSLLLIAAALKVMDSIDFDNIKQKFFVLVGLVGVLAAITVAIATLMDGKSVKGTAFMIAFAINLLVMTVALKKISDIPLLRIRTALYGVTAIIVAMALLARAMRTSIFHNNFSIGSALTLIAMAVSLGLVLRALNKYMDTPLVKKVEEKVKKIIEVAKQILDKIKAIIIKIIEYGKFILSGSEEAKEKWKQIKDVITGDDGLFKYIAEVILAVGAGILLAGLGGFKAIFGFIGAVLAIFSIIYIIKDLCNYIEANNITVYSIERLGKVIEAIFKWIGIASLLAGGLKVKWKGGSFKLGGASFGPLILVASLWLLFEVIKSLLRSGLKIDDIDALSNIVGRLAILFGAAVFLAGLSKNSAGGIGAMTIAVIALMVVVTALSALKPEEIKAIGTIADILVEILIGLGIGLALSSRVFNRLGRTLLAMAVLIVAVAQTLYGLQSVDMNKAIPPLIALGVIMILIVALMFQIEKMKFDWGQVGMLILMLGSLVIITFALKSLLAEDVNWYDMLVAAVALGGTMVLLAWAFNMISGLSATAGSMVALSAGMLLLASGAAILAAGMSLLAACPWQGILSSILALVVVLGALVVIALVVSTVGAGAFLVASGVIAVFSVALIVLSLALVIVSDLIEIFINKVRKFFGMEEIPTSSAGDALLEKITSYRDAFKGLTGDANDAEEAVKEAMNVSDSASTNSGATHIGLNRPGANNFRYGGGTASQTTTARTGSGVLGGPEAGSVSSKEIINESRDIGGESGTAAAEAFIEQYYSQILGSNNPELANLLEMMSDQGSEGGEQAGIEWLNSFGGILGSEDYTDLFDLDGENGSLFGDSDLTGMLSGLTSSMSTGGEQGATEFMSSFTQILKGSDFADTITSTITDGVSEAFSGEDDTFSGAIDGWISSAGEKVPALRESGKNIATEFIGSITSALTAGKDGVEEEGKNVGASAILGLSKYVGNAYGSGQDYILGFGNGISSLAEWLYGIAYSMGIQVIEAIKAAGEVASPSKKAISIGEYYGKGLIIGLDNMTDRVYSSGQDLGVSALSSLDSMLDMIQEKMNAEHIYEPTIRPIFDFTNVTNGAKQIDSILSGNSKTAAMAIGYASQMQADRLKLETTNQTLRENQGKPTTVNVNVTTKELSNSTVDYLVDRVNRILGGKV